MVRLVGGALSIVLVNAFAYEKRRARLYATKRGKAREEKGIRSSYALPRPTF